MREAAAIIIYGSGAVILFCMYAIFCTIRTGKQRRAIMDRIFYIDGWRHIVDEYDQVSFDQHMWCLIRFGNPRKLYGPLVRKCMGWS